MGIEKIIQYLNRKPTPEEIQELLNFGVVEDAQAQELANVSVQNQAFDLRPEQKLAVFQLGRQKVIFVDDDTGNGKTAIAIKGIQNLEQEVLHHPVKSLFFSPNTIKSQWNRRLLTYLPQGYIDPDEIVILGNQNGNGYDAIADSKVTIINYERIARGDQRLIDAIREAGFTFVNFDEFQRAKNPGGKTSQQLRVATTGIPYRMATTASPYRRSLKDVANLLSILDPEFYAEEQRREIERNPNYAQDFERLTDGQKRDLSLFIISKFVRGENISDVGPLRSQYLRVRRKGSTLTTEQLTGKKVSLDYELGSYNLSEVESQIYHMFRNADFHFPEVILVGAEKLQLLRQVLQDVSVLTPQLVREKVEEKKRERVEGRTREQEGNAYESVYTKLEKIFETHPEMRDLGAIESSRYLALRNVLNNIPTGEEVVVFTDKKLGVVKK